ncbi:MAG: hypothetical protein M3134_10875 [Actinomycetota bacterium]|nr:hypothetical protein [Actinomycetota bacterium]
MHQHADGTTFEEWLKRVGYEQSRTVEKLMEHVFLAEVLQECWFARRQIVEVLHAEVDASGYDVVLAANGRIRYVQLKASRKGGKTARQTINARLKEKDGGCVVWVTYDVDATTWRTRLGYRWWDGDRSDLPVTVGRNPHTKKDRPNTVVLKKSDFELVDSTAALVDRLFGPI